MSKETEEKILNAAVEIFAKKGYSAATTSEIARAAQVAEGTIFRYFPKKKELLHGIAIKSIDLFAASIVINPLEKIIKDNNDKSTVEILKLIILNRIELFEKYFNHIKVLLFEIQFHDDVKEIFIDKITKPVISIGIDIVERGKNRGEIKDVNSLIVMRSLIGMVLTMIIQRKMIPEVNLNLNIEEEVDILIDTIFNGIRK